MFLNFEHLMRSVVVTLIMVSIACAAQSNVEQQACMSTLDDYFTHKINTSDMKKYLHNQYEVTTYRVYGTVIANRLYQAERIKKGERAKKEPTKYTGLIKEYLPLMAKDNADNPKFIKARRSFELEPLSIKALAQLSPFLQKTIVQHTAVFDRSGADNYMLDKSDFILLNTLADVEEDRGSAYPLNFLSQIEKTAENGYISHVDAQLNIPIMANRRVLPYRKRVEDFLKSLNLSRQCDVVRNAVGREFETDQGLVSGDGSLYSFMLISEMGEKIIQKLHNAILKRTDMREIRNRSDHSAIFYVGKRSAWGSIEDGTYLP